MHLLMMGTLYTAAVSFIALLFQYINHFILDPLQYHEYYGISQSIRWSLSALVIVFPVFVWTARYLERDFVAHAEKQQLAIRRWLLNLTLFVAAITIIVDLITLIYNYLGGELTTRFLLKILVVLAVAIAIFAYYIWELRRESPERPAKMRRLGHVIIGAVAVIAVGGFVIAGSPKSERLRRFDLERVNGLQTIQTQVVEYWQRKELLPESLNSLRNDIAGFIPPQDPETQEPYAYRATGDLTFELCATFALPSENLDPRYPKAIAHPMGPYDNGLAQTWDHETGWQCFERAIDPEFYKPHNKDVSLMPPVR